MKISVPNKYGSSIDAHVIENLNITPNKINFLNLKTNICVNKTFTYLYCKIVTCIF